MESLAAMFGDGQGCWETDGWESGRVLFFFVVNIYDTSQAISVTFLILNWSCKVTEELHIAVIGFVYIAL